MHLKSCENNKLGVHHGSFLRVLEGFGNPIFDPKIKILGMA